MCSHCRTARGRIRRWRSRGLALWALVNGGLVALGFSEWPLISLMLGLAGACAIVTMGTLLARAHWLEFPALLRRAFDRHLSRLLPADGGDADAAAARPASIHDIGTISLIVTVVGVAGALAIWRMALAAGANFLFERPAAFWIAPKKAASRAAGGGVASRSISLSSPGLDPAIQYVPEAQL